MRRFVFRLEAVLRLRRFELARARARLGVLQAEWTRRETRVREAHMRVEHGETRLREEMEQGVDGRRLGLHAAGLASGRFERAQAEANRDRLTPELEAQRSQVEQARIRIRSLEKLSERRASAHAARARRLDQAELDELALTRAAHAIAASRSGR